DGGCVKGTYRKRARGSKRGNMGDRIVGDCPSHARPAWSSQSKRRGVDGRRIHRLAEGGADDAGVGADPNITVGRRNQNHRRRCSRRGGYRILIGIGTAGGKDEQQERYEPDAVIAISTHDHRPSSSRLKLLPVLWDELNFELTGELSTQPVNIDCSNGWLRKKWMTDAEQSVAPPPPEQS